MAATSRLKPYAAVRTSTGYDVVDLATGVVVGEMECHDVTAYYGPHVRPAWTRYRILGGATVVYAPFDHGKGSVTMGAATIYAAARHFLSTLARSA